MAPDLHHRQAAAETQRRYGVEAAASGGPRAINRRRFRQRDEEKRFAPGEDRPQPAGKVLPADRFETDKWQVMDADVRFKGRRIEHGGTLPISDLSTHVILEDGDLRLQPVRFGTANGSIAGSVHLQGDKSRCRVRPICRRDA